MHTILIFTSVNSVAKQQVFEEIIAKLGHHAQFQVECSTDLATLQDYLEVNPRICAILYDFDAGGLETCHQIQAVNPDLPIFAFTSNKTHLDVDLEILNLNLYFISYKADQADTICQRIYHSIDEYLEELIPPFTKALFDYAGKNIYSYCTPGHAGGTAFLKSPLGASFYDFYGPNIFKCDLSISMPELGALLDHSGKHKEAEEYIAKLYGSDHAYIVTNGTSTANKIIGMHVLAEGSAVLVDRNCHKSITHLLMMTNVTPIYLQASRNYYGIMGGISKSQLDSQHIANKVKKIASTLHCELSAPDFMIVTNSTYDGFLYQTNYIKQKVPVNNIHFDGAWIAYAPFHGIYKGHYGMSGDAPEGKVIYESYSTHKLLAAFSQSSTIQVKGNSFDADAFNDSFMMHTSTSPFYPIVAATETAAGMMRGRYGDNLMHSALKEAFQFRQEVELLRKENNQKADGWFYDILQPESIGNDFRCFPVTANENWHGFDGEEMSHMVLDPLKVTLLMPGITPEGTHEAFGIPACLLAKFLDYQNIVVEKVGPYNVLFLFGIGSDRSSSLKLLNELASFKRGFDENHKVEKILPNLYREAPRFYKKYGIQELATEIHQLYTDKRLCQYINDAYEAMPTMTMTPYQARQHIIKQRVVKTPLGELYDKVAAEMVLPYPPGIPLLLPGEMVTKNNRSMIEFLQTLCQIGDSYPGLETSIHGLYYDDTMGYYTYTIAEQ